MVLMQQNPVVASLQCQLHIQYRLAHNLHARNAHLAKI